MLQVKMGIRSVSAKSGNWRTKSTKNLISNSPSGGLFVSLVLASKDNYLLL